MSDDEPEFFKCPCKECGNNIEFPESSARSTITCPHCGEWTELTAPKESAKTTINLGPALMILCPLLLFLVIAGAIHHFQYATPPKTDHSKPLPIAKSEPKPVPKPVVAPTNPPTQIATQAVVQAPIVHRPKSPADLKAGEVTLEKSKGSSLVYAIGEVQNDSEYQRFSVRIELELISLKGAKLGTAADYKAIIEPHQTWHFHALIPDPKTVAAKLHSLTEE